MTVPEQIDPPARHCRAVPAYLIEARHLNLRGDSLTEDQPVPDGSREITAQGVSSYQATNGGVR